MCTSSLQGHEVILRELSAGVISGTFQDYNARSEVTLQRTQEVKETAQQYFVQGPLRVLKRLV